ncbi:hypothetical protein DPEC_G00286050 [Dallia pectoralis]|uniref:Uncharacterized protein n=1 Tax=Dallia pectoralis TaxID=75939 RepID=A0ACC2FJV4_DALPE|nr:hypothetical protein DPEC_G00286050 [Dallia pectoralis]
MLQEAHKVVCGPSLLSNSLRVYLNNKNRLQPIIGLSSMTECVKLSGDSDAVYLCEVCVCRLRKTDVRSHIMGSLHRYNYIKVRHPHFMSEWKQSTELSKMARPLMEMAQILENREGTGDVQVLKLEAAMYEEISSRSESDVHVLVHAIKAEQAQGEPRSQSETTLARSGYLPVQSQRTVISPRMLSDQPEKAAVVIDSQKEGVVQRSNPLMGSSVKSHASASPRTYDNCPCLIHDDVTAEGQRLLGGSEGEGARQDGVPTKLIQCEPVFKVSLSLTDGPLLVKRNSFSLEPFPGSPTHSSVDASLQPVAKGLVFTPRHSQPCGMEGYGRPSLTHTRSQAIIITIIITERLTGAMGLPCLSGTVQHLPGSSFHRGNYNSALDYSFFIRSSGLPGVSEFSCKADLCTRD